MGRVHYLSADGKLRLAYATGDEVKQVATGDLDGDGIDEILAGSLNYNVYCFGADGQRRWRVDLGRPHFGTGHGAADERCPGHRWHQYRAACQHRLVRRHLPPGPISVQRSCDVLVGPQSVFVATADGLLRSVSVVPQ